MLIHELSQQPKKVNEGIGDFFGLNNPTVSKAWNALGSDAVHELSARFTKDPRYVNIKDLSQRKRAIEHDEYLQKVSQQYADAWNKQLNEIEIRNGATLTDQQYQAALGNWMNATYYKNKFGQLDPNMQAKAKAHFAEITRNRNDPKKILELFSSLAADQAAREVEVQVNAQQQPVAPAGLSAPVGGAPKAGTPTASELQKFNQLVASAAKAQS